MNFKLLHKVYYCFLLTFLLLTCKISYAQVQQKDFSDVVSGWKKDTLPKPNTDLLVGKTYYSLLPVIGYAPANGFLIGGAISLSRRFGPVPTNLSSGMLNFQVTTKNQFIVNARSKIYMPGNKWFFQGDWRLMLFTQPTYGLGINNSEFNKMHIYVNNLDEQEDTLAEPMDFKLIRFYEEGTRKLGDSHIYAGLGIMIDQHFGIEDLKLDTVVGSPTYYITNHYKYSDTNNYNPVQYGNNGIKFTLLTDTRDNISNCYHGYYASVSLVTNVKIGNNSKSSMQFLYDARYYLGISSRNPRHVLAFWSYGSFMLNGNKVPYLALPSIGWDTYNRSGRGFIQGRFRGLNMVYNEAEYRFPISKNGLFGGVVYVNATTASNYTKKLFDKTAFGRGAGVRLQLDKRARTNLTVDIGLGADRATAIYFNLQEAF
ncbi:MAG: BamA/TamA family outer membrane protein [Bacteroidota bacterium]